MFRSFFDIHQLPILKYCVLFLVVIWVIPVTASEKRAEFVLPDLDGIEHKLSDYRGKWVVVNYWATWCPPCLDEIPELVDFHEDHKDKDAVVIGVDFEDIPVEKLKTFVEDYFMSYPILRMKPGPRSELGLISGLPTSFLISPEGKVIAKQTGPVTAKMIEDFIDEQEKR